MLKIIKIYFKIILMMDPLLMKDFLGERECAFHIMNSQFLHRDAHGLSFIANKIQELKAILNPLYISDHLGLFFMDKLPLISMEEVFYHEEESFLFSKIHEFQALLNMPLCIENYPSIFERGKFQKGFFEKLIDQKKIQLLFDISNAVVSQKNNVFEYSHWDELITHTKNFHIAGYNWSSTSPSLCIDTHDNKVSEESLTFLSEIKKQVSSDTIKTISIERDDNFIINDWIEDIQIVRETLNANE
jgi:uncharacterized protein (UPF0276 family)